MKSNKKNLSKYQHSILDNKIIFKNNETNKELIVTHYDEEYISDTIILDNSYELDFILYIVKTLKKSNDILCLDVLYDSKELERRLEKEGLKVSNYQYLIRCKDSIEYFNQYEVIDDLNSTSKEYYLNKINKAIKINHEYYNPSEKISLYSYKIFENDEYSYLTYKYNNKVVGIVDYKIFEESSSKAIHDIYNYNNKLCIRSLLADNKEIMEYILKDLCRRFMKDIVINITYTEEVLREAIISCDGEFNRCLYLLIK